MRTIRLFPLVISLLMMAGTTATGTLPPLVEPLNSEKMTSQAEKINLPDPNHSSNTSIEEALLKRRSVRQYTDEPLSLSEISQILWAAQGITNNRGFRTAPSAGALYPLEVYILIDRAEEAEPGIYKYDPEDHTLTMVQEGRLNDRLQEAALGQSQIGDAAAVLVISGVYERTTGKYKNRGVRYVHMEAGHAAQNVYLQGVALDLGAVVIGAFDDESVRKVMNMPEKETPLYIMPVGKK
ncbi:MAG: SagB/ThcOx family dehydrogenase [Marinilabiliaceae bacterium]